MSADLTYRLATEADLPELVHLLKFDGVAAQRESALVLDAHRQALAAIDTDPNHELVIAAAPSGALAGFAQLSFLPGLTYAGGWRAQIEGVRVEPAQRGQGVGRELINECVGRARQRGCVLVQLTTDRQRPEAVAFYKSLGFADSHHGMKLKC